MFLTINVINFKLKRNGDRTCAKERDRQKQKGGEVAKKKITTLDNESGN